ncbi:MAG: NAD-dependent epimerase/dehydratase family protein [Paludibacteraceae bacterium]
MNILITGIHGFVGTNLVKVLKNDCIIYGLDIIAPEKDGVIKTFLWSELDKIPEVDVIIHLAGKAHDTKNKADAKVYFDVNTRLTEQIYDYFFASNCNKFIYFSSVKAAADKVEGDVLTEDIVPKPVGPYGESKIKAEEYILSKQNECENKQKKSYILRPCMIHGAGNKGNLNLLYTFVKKGIPWPLGAYENKRSFCSVDNLSFVINQLIEKNIAGGIYNIGDDDPVSTNELIQLIAESANKKPRIWRLPAITINAIAKLGSILHFPLNENRLRKLTENYVVGNEKIKKALNIDKMPVTSVEGMKKTLKSFQK